MRLKFVSDGKIIEFDGSGQCDGSIISVSGLEGVTRDYQTVKYVDVPGQITVAENVLPREIVVKGDIFLKNSMNFSGYCNFFDQWGLLHILRDTSRKKIAYKPVYFKRVGDNGDFVSQKDNCNVVIGWMPIEELQNVTIYPEFLKKEIYNLNEPMKHFVSKG